MEGLNVNFSSTFVPEYEKAHTTIGACNIVTSYPTFNRNCRPTPDFQSPPLNFKLTEKLKQEGKRGKFAGSSYKNEEQTLQLRHSRIYITLLKRNPNFDDTYTESFLAHARLYIFAKTYCVDLLRAVVLGKLKQMFNGSLILSNPDVGSQTHLAMLAALVEYTYTNTVDLPNNPDPLRMLVYDYAFADHNRLKTREAFMDLYRRKGSLQETWLRRPGSAEIAKIEAFEREISHTCRHSALFARIVYQKSHGRTRYLPHQSIALAAVREALSGGQGLTIELEECSMGPK